MHVLLPLLLACAPTPVPGDGAVGSDGGAETGSPPDGGTTGQETGDPGDGGLPDGGAADGGSADGGTPDGGAEDTGTDGGADTGTPEPETWPPGLCHMALDCGRAIPDEPKIRCSFVVTDSEGAVQYDGYAGVELRGRSSASAPKHQYSIELWDDDLAEVSADFFGMGGESDWILNGNYYDRALVRNALGFDLFRAANEVGDPSTPRYAPEHRYCDLTLEGEWIGIYSLLEKIKRDDDRIDIVADDGTGSSFVLKLDDSGYDVTNRLGYGGWKVEYPRDPDAAQLAGIEAWISGWGQAGFLDPARLEDWVDVDSFIDLILLEELVKNNDAYYLSLFVWKDRDGRLEISPWDLDLTLGQPSYNDNENPYTWVAYRPALVSALAGLPGFHTRLEKRWAALRAGPWATVGILARIDAYQETMGADAIARNFEVWPIESIAFGHYLYEVSSYAEEDARVRAWVTERAAWMDEHIGEW